MKIYIWQVGVKSLVSLADSEEEARKQIKELGKEQDIGEDAPMVIEYPVAFEANSDLLTMIGACNLKRGLSSEDECKNHRIADLTVSPFCRDYLGNRNITTVEELYSRFNSYRHDTYFLAYAYEVNCALNPSLQKSVIDPIFSFLCSNSHRL